jgi:hypothetical protein
MTLLVATLLVAVVAYRLATVLDLRGDLDRVLAAAVIATSQIVGSMLVAGAVLGALKPGVVLLVNAVVVLVVVALTRDRSWRLKVSPPPPATLAAAVRAHPWSSALVALAAIALAWRLLIAYTFPPYSWDGLAYHLTAVAGWLQDERIGENQLHIYASTFPMNGELVGAWLALFHRTDTWIDAFQMPFAIIGAIAVAGLARLAGASRSGAVAAGCVFVLSPIVQTQATAEYVDLFVAALFLASLYLLLRATQSDGRSTVYFVLAGCAAGLAVGGKPTGPFFLLALLVSLVAGLLIGRRPRSLTHRVIPVLLFLVPALALSGFWYARDAVEHSNPIYPARVELAGEVILRGPGVTQMAPPGTTSQRAAVLRSWGHDLTRLFHGATGRYHEYGEVQGGMGLVWLLLGLPLLAVFVVQLASRRSALFWTFLVPVGLLFALQPYRWWSRFTIVLLAPALVALVVVLESITSRLLRIAIQSLTLVFAAIAVWFSSGRVIQWDHVYDLRETVSLAGRSPGERTLGRLFLPSFRWVDDIEPNARIATAIPVYINEQQCADCPDLPFFYGLYGHHFDHRVFRLRGSDRDSMLAWLRRNRIDYVYVSRRTRYARWLASDPAFRLLHEDGLVAAYATGRSAAGGVPRKRAPGTSTSA